LAAAPRIAPQGHPAAAREGATEDRVVARKKRSGQLRSPEAPRGFGVAGRGEVQGRQRDKNREVPERGVEGRNEKRRRIRFEEGEPLVLRDRVFEHGGVAGSCQSRRQALDAEQRERETGREQGVDESRRGRQERPPRTRGRAIPERKARAVDEGRRRPCLL